ncbi:MAG: NAD(P)-dependent oxidoreductase [Chitinophagaceae bacterium]
MQQVLIIAPVPHNILTILRAYNIVVDYQPNISYQELGKCIAHYEGMIFSTRIPLDKTILSNAYKMKWMGRLGSGLDHVDVLYASKKNICILTTPEGNAPSVGEHVLTVILAILHNICKANYELKQGKWTRNENTPTEIKSKTIGIVGMGHTGTAVAKVLENFECKLIGYDKYKSSIYEYVEPVSMETILQESDIITFHVPLTEETKHMINISLLTRTKKYPILINVSRGEILILEDLIHTLNKKIITAAAIDVFENENWNTLSSKQQHELHQLSQMSNVILSPHIAGVSYEAKLRMPQILIEKLLQQKWIDPL